MTERWKTVVTNPNYEVSTLGRLRRSDNKREKATVTARNGYLVANLWQNGTGKVVYLHDLVTAAFLGPKPKGSCVNHIDANRTNGKLTNLEYTTFLGNARHTISLDRHARGERNARAKLTESDARAIKRRANAGERTCDLAIEFGVRPPIISQIKNGSRWTHLTDSTS